jgi:spermidine-citrate ligase
MHRSAKHIAENATFQAFMNSYIREVNSGEWIEKDEWMRAYRPSVLIISDHVLELDLSHQGLKFAFGVDYRSIVGRHNFGTCLKYCAKEKRWQQEDKLIVLLALIQELHLLAKNNREQDVDSKVDELILRLIESYQMMTNYVENRMVDAKELYQANRTFIENEQSLLFGHWLHPTPKSRQGMLEWHHTTFAPELCGEFELYYFKVNRNLIEEDSALHANTSAIIHHNISEYLNEKEISNKYCFIPMHPLQAEWLVQQNNVKAAIKEGLIESIGPLGAPYTATSSLRTIYNAEQDWMYKFSIPVKVTNSLRVNRNHELKAGVVMAKLMKKIDFLEYNPRFQIIDDPAYITVNLKDGNESGFEVILRSNAFLKEKDEGVSMLAAIVQDPLPSEKSQLYNIVATIAEKERRTLEEVSLDWYKEYWKCSIDPLIRLYAEHGIALEAHQQNSVLDISSGYPTTYYYRDNQGYYLSKSHEEELCMIEPSLQGTKELFYEDTLIRERFTYYLFMNQLFSVIHRFGADGLIDEKTLLHWSITQLRLVEKQLHGQGKVFVKSILEQEELASKANLLTRFHDIDELTADLEQAVYTKIPNPFILSSKEEEYATAY